MADEQKQMEDQETIHQETEEKEAAEAIFAEGTPEAETEAADDIKQSEQLAELQAKLDESEDRYIRLRADFDNFRRRMQLDREASEKYRAQALITNLLPAIDNFERAMQITPDNEQTKQLLQGVEMVYKSIQEALKQEGIEIIESVGKEFDPYYHQAIMQVEDESYGSNVVVEEFQKGYILKDRVIRPSMVKVNQ
ncbi:nucleotide exchange factor GrpE [Heyndrickxia acidicola]|uniref:Protein GrpE n=1 Tax=Heyndrickxia acidicola TaxID=209389 RepID=A0ABU6MLA1_9BACI|nr:nucleotide exchange factor GrpE [Heyndrickxia acidicola]MED1205079.1 nucleotide exchange factor GrpE [Heyndrickxia acidicola]